MNLNPNQICLHVTLAILMAGAIALGPGWIIGVGIALILNVIAALFVK